MTGCRGIGSKIDPCGPYFLQFDGATSGCSTGSVASIEDLLLADFTIDGYFYANSTGEGANGTIFFKNFGAGNGWVLRFAGGNTLEFLARYGVQDCHSTFAFIPDSAWHHLAVVFDVATGFADIYLDGVEVTYTLHDAGGGVYGTDVGGFLYFGTDVAGGAGTTTWDGYLSWWRFSDNERFSGAFIAPIRCTLPDGDANTIVTWWFGEGQGAWSYPYYRSFGPVGGAWGLFYTLWGCDCDDVSGANDPTCAEEEVFISNHHVQSNITHVFTYYSNIPSWSGNLLNGSIPHTLFSNNVAVGDLIYFGVDSTLIYACPFSSLVFDILTAVGSGVTGLVWEYWNGAWVALTTQDNTNADGLMTGVAFDTTGVKSVHWILPSDLATTAINGITAWWVRVRVSAVSGVAADDTPPWQQNRNIYAVNWPYIEVNEDDIGGDIEALIKARIQNQSDKDTAIAAVPELPVERLICGLRSLDRGADFSAYLNCADNDRTDITVTVPAAQSAFGTSNFGPTGRVVVVTNAITSFLDTYAVQFVFSPDLSKQFYGTYRCFITGYQSSVAAGGLEIKCHYGFLDGLKVWGSIAASWVNINNFEILDLGIIELPPGDFPVDDYADQLFIGISTKGTTGTEDCVLFSVILIPVDEWSADNIYPYDEDSGLSRRGTADQRVLDIDSITYPKKHIRSVAREETTEYIRSNWQVIANGPAVMQANKNQRLWFTSAYWESSAWVFFQETADTVSIEKTQRYFSFRGDR